MPQRLRSDTAQGIFATDISRFLQQVNLNDDFVTKSEIVCAHATVSRVARTGANHGRKFPSLSSLCCQASTCFRIGSRFRCTRSTPPMHSVSANDFECLARTGVNTPETMRSSCRPAVSCEPEMVFARQKLSRHIFSSCRAPRCRLPMIEVARPDERGDAVRCEILRDLKDLFLCQPRRPGRRFCPCIEPFGSPHVQ